MINLYLDSLNIKKVLKYKNIKIDFYDKIF